MIFKPYYLGCLAHASYLVGDERTMSAVIVDPQRDVGGYIADAAEAGLTIRHVILTHFHADFVAGHLELAAATGASIHLGAQARAEYAFHPLHDGEGIELGSVRLVALETPGHTPESITVLVYDLAKDSETPQIALTGDTLFVGDVGRPDLVASAGTSANVLAELLYDTIHEKLAALPDEVQVWPAHGAGSMCGKNLSSERSSTIGAQKQSNWAFRAMSKAEFAREATTDLPLQPAYFGHAADLNRRRRPTLGAVLERELVAVPLERILQAIRDGDTVLDAREPDDFARGHIGGSVNIGLSGKYASWAGVLLDRDRRIWLVAAPGKETEAAMRLGRIGFDHVAGYLEGGSAAFEKGSAASGTKPDHVRSFQRRTAAELAAELASTAPPHVLDVRAQSEWNDKHIEGAQLVPLDQLEERIGEVPKGKRIVVHCAGGYRSSVAASLLMKHGRTQIEDLIGGIGAWVAAGNPTTR
jgi:glyoxylase-like metal-dependent hydrolase (beta-lactamase superfamily II)/rhodanese-related sulfurtransferase